MRRQGEIDAAIALWTSSRTANAVVEQLVAAAVPASTIYTVADMFADPHYRARGLFESVEAGGRALVLPAMLPRLAATPGGTDWAGPELGAHNVEVFCGELGLSADELAELQRPRRRLRRARRGPRARASPEQPGGQSGPEAPGTSSASGAAKPESNGRRIWVRCHSRRRSTAASRRRRAREP